SLHLLMGFAHTCRLLAFGLFHLLRPLLVVLAPFLFPAPIGFQRLTCRRSLHRPHVSVDCLGLGLRVPALGLVVAGFFHRFHVGFAFAVLHCSESFLVWGQCSARASANSGRWAW